MDALITRPLPQAVLTKRLYRNGRTQLQTVIFAHKMKKNSRIKWKNPPFFAHIMKF